MKNTLNSILHSFPVQLLFVHIKRNHFLILFWIFLICIITNVIGGRYGVNLLFLDPEYLGHEGFTAYLILGFFFGGFLVVWNITSYLLNVYRFSFLATLSRPFGIYCLNNAILPVLFFSIYIFNLVGFQTKEGLLNLGDISLRVGGFLAGLFILVFLTMIYFFRTNKDILQITGGIKKRKLKRGEIFSEHELTHEETGKNKDIGIDNYINHTLRFKLARPAGHYPESVIRSVYKQHHINALFVELCSLALVFILGSFMDYPFFRIPAAASMLLLFSIFIILLGAFGYWLGQWKLFALFLLLFLLDFMLRNNLLEYKNKAYGILYTKPLPEYSVAQIQQLNNPQKTKSDYEHTIEILNTWKQKFTAEKEKPKMVIINCSGGGLRATMFAMSILQKADSTTNSELMQHCTFITGASGGMVAAAYYRELYYRKMQGENINLNDKKYLQNISKDILNPVGFTLVVNDIIYPWQNFSAGNSVYKKDRGYMFEKILNENTEMVMDKKLGDYKEPEDKMEIPMMLFYPTIMNDERKLFIGSQQFSYLCVPQNRLKNFTQPKIDAVDIHDLLQNNEPDSLLFTSLLRMNCSFPYILPNVHLPTNPEIEIMDAGVRDNYGIETSTRFISTFKDWILENTGGVVVINIRGIEQELKPNLNLSNGLSQELVSPIGSLYSNWVQIQDFQNEYLLNYLSTILDGKLDVITFEYQPGEHTKRASLSFHLTTREKRDIINAGKNAKNMAAYNKLKEELK